MRPPSQRLPFPVTLIAVLFAAMLAASLLPGSGLAIGAVILVAYVVLAARGARPPKTPK
jgi:hypothetical protein